MPTIETGITDTERLSAYLGTSTDVRYRMNSDWSEMRELVGQHFLADTGATSDRWLIDYIHPDDQVHVRAVIDEAIRTERVFELEHRVKRADGSWGWTFSRAVPIFGAGGEIREWFGTASDVTAQRAAQASLRASEERQAFLLNLGDALRQQANPVEVQSGAMNMLGQHLGLDRCGYGEADASGTMMTFPRHYTAAGMAPLPEVLRLDDFGKIVVDVIRGGATLVIEDAAADLRLADPALQAPFATARIAAVVAVPLVKAGRLKAALFAHQSRPRAWTTSEITLIQEVAERTWAAAEQARAEAALRESEERYRTIFETMTEGFGIFELVRSTAGEPIDYRYLELNPALEAQTGVRRDQLVGRLFSEAFPETPELYFRYWVEVFARAIETQSVQTYDSYLPAIDRWLAGTVTPAGGQLFYVFYRDNTASKRAEQALRESEERLRQYGENSPDTLWIIDAQAGRLEYLSAGYEQMWGEPRERVMDDLTHWQEHIHPEDRERVAEGLPTLLAGKRHSIEYRIIRPDGGMRWILDTGFPITDDEGRVTRVAGVAQDLTARREAEDKVREGEERFRLLLEGIPQLVWRAVDHGLWSWASPQWTEFTGQAEADSHGLGWLDIVHPEDREMAREAWSGSISTDRYSVEYRLRMIEDGRYRWFSTRAVPVRDESGELVEWLGTSTDIDDLRRLQKHQQVLLGELQHRVRNSLAVIRSIARRTAETSATVEQFSMHLDGRLGAFARTQAAVSRDPTAGIDLRTIVVDELMAHIAWEGEHTKVCGPEIKLKPKAGETLALAFHELASNAVKFGALSVPNGMVRVSWRIDAGNNDEQQLVISWDEKRPGEALTPADRRGFGTDLLEDTLAYEMEADTLLDFRPSGLHCSIVIPLTEEIGREA